MSSETAHPGNGRRPEDVPGSPKMRTAGGLPMDTYTTGSWKPFQGHEDAFVAAWIEFSRWASTMPGAGRAILARDLRDPERFVSIVEWASIDAVRGWKTSPEFKPRMARVQAHIDKFAPTELEVVAACADGRHVDPTAPAPTIELAPGGAR